MTVISIGDVVLWPDPLLAIFLPSGSTPVGMCTFFLDTNWKEAVDGGGGWRVVLAYLPILLLYFWTAISFLGNCVWECGRLAQDN